MLKRSDHSLAPNRFSLPPIGGKVAGLTRELFRKRGFAEDHILAHWPDIAGDVIADYSAPERLVYPRRVREGRGPQGAATLEIRVDGPIALEIKHLEPQIIERINLYYGYSAVSRLKMTQGPLPIRPRARRRPIRALAPDEREALVQSLQSFAEPGLKDALARLGERILGELCPRGAKGPKYALSLDSEIVASQRVWLSAFKRTVIIHLHLVGIA